MSAAHLRRRPRHARGHGISIRDAVAASEQPREIGGKDSLTAQAAGRRDSQATPGRTLKMQTSQRISLTLRRCLAGLIMRRGTEPCRSSR